VNQQFDPDVLFRIEDNFTHLDTAKWASVDDGGTGANTVDGVFGGQCSIVTAGADNDYHLMVSRAAIFQFLRDKSLFFKARFSLTEAATDAANFAIGLSSVADATLLGNDGAGLPASFTGAVFHKVDGGTTFGFRTSNGAAHVDSADAVPFISGHAYQVGFTITSINVNEARIMPYIVDETAGKTYQMQAHKFYWAGAAQMYVVYGVKAGGSSAETLKMIQIEAQQAR